MRRIWGALAVAVFTPCLLGAQSLADAARQEKERLVNLAEKERNQIIPKGGKIRSKPTN